MSEELIRSRLVGRCSCCGTRWNDFISALNLDFTIAYHSQYCRGEIRLSFDGSPVELDRFYFRTLYPSWEYHVGALAPRVDGIESGVNRKHGVWFTEKNWRGSTELYTTCLCCGAIELITDAKISAEGIAECYLCGRCSFIARNKLLGGEEFRRHPRILEAEETPKQVYEKSIGR